MIPSVEVPQDDAQLIEMAKTLNISTRGKTREQISMEIVSKASQKPADHVEAVQVEPADASATPGPGAAGPEPSPTTPETPSQAPAAG